MAAINRKYADFDMSFKRHPITGDIGTKTDLEAVKQSIRNLIKCAPYDRKFHPEIGTRIKGMLFREVTSMSIRMIKTLISESLENYEPRIMVDRVDVTTSHDMTQYNVIVYFHMINTTNPLSVTTLLNRVR